MNLLVGMTLKQILLSEDRTFIQFMAIDGQILLAKAEGDCCSSTWIEDVLFPDAAIGSEILAADDIDLPEHLHTPTITENYEDSMEYYGFQIRTTKGVTTIAYRNSSNGYYGGRLDWCGWSIPLLNTNWRRLA